MEVVKVMSIKIVYIVISNKLITSTRSNHRISIEMLQFFYGLGRHATLAASHVELKERVATCEAEIELIRSQLQSYLKNSANTILTLNNDVSVTRLKVERKKQETADLQLNIDSMLQVVATKTLARSQVGT